jgi:hypothetical protein
LTPPSSPSDCQFRADRIVKAIVDAMTSALP